MTMLDVLSNEISDQLITNNIINEKDKEIYVFGIYQLIGFVFNIISSVAIFLILGKLREGLVFSFSYFILRSYAGGFHSKSTFKCYIISIFLICGAVVFMNTVYNSVFLWGIYLIINLLIYLCSPIDTENKRLDDIERKVYGFKTKKILFVLLVLNVCLAILHYSWINVSIITAVLFEGVMLIIGIISNNLNRISKEVK